jgi:hypothetical protein
MVEHAGRLVTEDELLEAVWPDTYVQPQAVKSQLFDVRRALGDNPKTPLFIETLPKRGYRFIAAVNESCATAPAAASKSAQSALVGRNRELAELGDCLRKTLVGQRQIVLVTGEPGIGKSALIDAFQAAQRATCRDSHRARTMWRATEARRYYPMLEALGQLCLGSEADFVVQTRPRKPNLAGSVSRTGETRTSRAVAEGDLGRHASVLLREIGDALETITSRTRCCLSSRIWVVDHPRSISCLRCLRPRVSQADVDSHVPPGGPGAFEPSIQGLKQDLLVHQLCRETLGAAQGSRSYRISDCSVVETSLPAGLAAHSPALRRQSALYGCSTGPHDERGLISREKLATAGRSGGGRLEVPRLCAR